jgi:SAM-dependent methyltransferase
MPHDHGHHHHGSATADSDDWLLPDLLDLDARVLHDYWTTALDLVAAQAPADVRRVVDLGAGTGTAAIAFAERFGDAEVIAVDSAEVMLERLAAKSPRVRTVHADLDSEWPITEPVDVTWASMSLHHLADPDTVLGRVHAATRPGGIMAVVEFDAPPRYLPDDLGLGRPGLEQRCLDALAHVHEADLPELGSDWPTRLTRAGFQVTETQDVAIDVRPTDEDGYRFAELWLGRLLAGAGEHLDAEDRQTLATLLDGTSPQSVRRRDDLHIRGVRTVTIARRV